MRLIAFLSPPLPTRSAGRPVHEWTGRLITQPSPRLRYGTDVRGLQALGALGDVELHLLALLEAAETVRVDRRVVAEHVLASTVLRDESEALRVVEPLHCTGCHVAVFSFFFVR